MGHVDLIQMIQVVWDTSPSNNGRKFKVEPLTPSSDLYEDAVAQRQHLVENLADYNETIADHVIRDLDLLSVPDVVIVQALRTATIQHGIVPVLCGSSFKNRGVQSLLDAIIWYLPNPRDIAHSFTTHYQDKLCALAFKMVHHKQRGALTFLRLYTGTLRSGDAIYNASRQCSEKVTRLLEVSADEFKDVAMVTEGHIAAVSGLKQTYTGDTVVGSSTEYNSAKRSLRKVQQNKEQDDDALLLAGD